MIAAIRGAIARGWFYNGHQPDRSWCVSARPSVKPSRHTVKAWRPTLPLSLECFPAAAATITSNPAVVWKSPPNGYGDEPLRRGCLNSIGQMGTPSEGPLRYTGAALGPRWRPHSRRFAVGSARTAQSSTFLVRFWALKGLISPPVAVSDWAAPGLGALKSRFWSSYGVTAKPTELARRKRSQPCRATPSA
jgi:hypothetical protein